jgi:hypothetical protein
LSAQKTASGRARKEVSEAKRSPSARNVHPMKRFQRLVSSQSDDRASSIVALALASVR